MKQDLLDVLSPEAGNSSRSAAVNTSIELKKECFSCGNPKPKAEFTEAEWEKPLRTGSCVDCCKHKARISDDESNRAPQDNQPPSTKSKASSTNETKNDILVKGTTPSDEEDGIKEAGSEGKDAGDNKDMIQRHSSHASTSGDADDDDKKTPAAPTPSAKAEDTASKQSATASKTEVNRPANPIPSPSTEARKQCHSCRRTKPKSEFSPAQYRRPAGTGRCQECCVKASSATNTDAAGTTSVTNRFPAAPNTTANVTNTAPNIRSEVSDTSGDEPSSKDDPMPASASSTQEYVKPCFECGQEKPQSVYTASQWKKRVGTGKCITCVSKSVQWKTNPVCSNLQTKICDGCKESKSHTEFSPNQWKKTLGTGRCKECVQKSLLYA